MLITNSQKMCMMSKNPYKNQQYKYLNKIENQSMSGISDI